MLPRVESVTTLAGADLSVGPLHCSHQPVERIGCVMAASLNYFAA